LDAAIATYREALAGGDEGARFGLARALAWDGQHSAAVLEYDRILARSPNDRAAQNARAEVLGWADRQGAASAAWAAIAKADPGNMAAQRNLARALSWRGQYRRALAVIDAMPAEAQADRDTAVIAAESLIWMGRPDRAEPLLRDQQALHPDDRHMAWLLGEVQRHARPELRIDGRSFDQSDDLAIDALAADVRFPLEFGRGQIGARYVHTSYRPPQGPVQRISVDQPVVYAGYRISDAVELSTAASLDIINTRGGPGDFTKPTFEAYVTVRPSDMVRIDLGGSRSTFDSEATLTSGLTATQWGGSIDVVPVDHVVVTARGHRTTYSDGNARTWGQVEIAKRLIDSPRVIASYRYTNFTYRTPGQPGYYNPAGFHSHEGQLRSWGRLGGALRYDLRLVGGRETERPGGSRWIVNAGASVTWEASPTLEVEGGYDFSTSRTASSGGFERGIARLTLRKRF
jgi:thioredoxin-like negative regulator of GroEL